jgi:dsRNA-specific ribonuclease
MLGWVWIGGMSLATDTNRVRTSIQTVDGSVSWEPTSKGWLWHVWVDSERVARGVASSARLAMQEAEQEMEKYK